MSTLYIIGNGFDLAHGLKTSYSDFLIWYLKDCAKKKIYNRGFEDQLIKLDGYEDIPNIEDITFKSIEEIKYFINSNSIKLIPTDGFVGNIFAHEKEYNWVDIESIYFDILLAITKSSSSIEYKFNAIKKLNSQLEYLKNKLEEYLTSLDKTIIPRKDIQSLFNKEINNTPTLVLNFNYTTTVENYINNSDRIQILNIHGKLNEPESPIIFGYGDEMHPEYEIIERLNIDEFLVNFKSF